MARGSAVTDNPEFLRERIEELEFELERVKRERDKISDSLAKADTARRRIFEQSHMLACALRLLVNAPLPEDLDTERPFWVAARNARATLSATQDLTGVDGEQDR